MNNSVWTNLHGIGLLSWYNGPSRSVATLVLRLTYYLAVQSTHVTGMLLCSHAVYRRYLLTMRVWIRHTLICILILIGITQVCLVISPLLMFLLDVYHFSKQFLFSGYIIKNLHSIIDHPRVILHIKTLSLRILRAMNAVTILWLLHHQFLWLLLLLEIWRRSIASILSRRSSISHTGLLAYIQRLNTVALVRQLVWCHLNSVLSTILS